MIALLLFIAQILLVSYFSVFAFYNYLYSFASLRKKTLKTVKHNNPKVAVVIVAYNESNVIADTVVACEKLSYPNLQIILADDSDSGVSIEVLRQIRQERGCKRVYPEEYNNRKHINIYESKGFTLFHRTKKAGFKAGCLKDLESYLKANDFEYMYLLDAEWWPQDDAVDRLVEVIEADKNLAYVQARRENGHGAMKFLQRCIALSDNGCYYVDLEGRQAVGDPILFTGCCTLFRLEHMYASGGFLPGHLTEDIDLTNRIYLAGFKGAYVGAVQNDGEVPPNYYAFRRQQDRWATGTARALKEYFWPIIRSKKLSFKEKFSLLRQNAYYTSSVAIEVSIVLALLSLLLMVWSPDSYQGALYVAYMYSIRWPYTVALLVALLSGFLPVIMTCIKRRSLEDLWVIPSATWLSWSLLHTYFMANMKGFFNIKQDWFLTPKSNRNSVTLTSRRDTRIKMLNLVTACVLVAIYGIQWIHYSRIDIYAFFWLPALIKGLWFS